MSQDSEHKYASQGIYIYSLYRVDDLEQTRTLRPKQPSRVNIEAHDGNNVSLQIGVVHPCKMTETLMKL